MKRRVPIARRTVNRLHSVAPAPRARAVSHTGARTDLRELQNWLPRLLSADEDTLKDRVALNARAADLDRNDPLASGATNTQVTKVVGTGLNPQPRVNRRRLAKSLGVSAEQADSIAKAFEEVALEMWWAVAGTTAIDASRACTFAELTEQVLRGALVRGDIFAERQRHAERLPDDHVGLAVRLYEGDRVSNPENRVDSASIRAGLEHDAAGIATACWVKSTAPGSDFGLGGRETWSRIAMFGAASRRRQVLHILRRKRPGQTRGITYLSGVIAALKQLSRYFDAELMAAVVSAAFTVFVTSEGAGGLAGEVPPPVWYNDGTTPLPVDRPVLPPRIDIGAVVQLEPGQGISTANPGRPNDKFQPFYEAIAQGVGVSLEIPSEILLKKFNASYTAARGALLELWEAILVSRAWLVEAWCQPVYEWLIHELVATGQIEAPGFLDDALVRRAYLNAEWVGPSPGQLDPLKEVLAAKERVAATFSTRQSETAALTARDWDENVAQTQHERNELARRGVPDMIMPAATAGRAGQEAGGAVDEGANTPPAAVVAAYAEAAA